MVPIVQPSPPLAARFSFGRVAAEGERGVVVVYGALSYWLRVLSGQSVDTALLLVYLNFGNGIQANERRKKKEDQTADDASSPITCKETISRGKGVQQGRAKCRSTRTSW